MKPTPRLRFVERVINVCTSPDGTVSHGTMVRILQQWWEAGDIALAVHITDKDGNTLPSPRLGEWRDVPLEKEA